MKNVTILSLTVSAATLLAITSRLRLRCDVIEISCNGGSDGGGAVARRLSQVITIGFPRDTRRFVLKNSRLIRARPAQGNVPAPFPTKLSRYHSVVTKSETNGNWLEKLQGEIVAEAAMNQATGNVELPVMFIGEKDDRRFDFDRWELHRGPSRYGRLLLGTLIGVTTRRIATTVTLLVAFSGLVSTYSEQARLFPGLPEVALPLTPFELTTPVLGLLLVFRTNTAYNRFDRGTAASWEMTNRMRSIMRLLVVFTSRVQVPKPEREAVPKLIDACCLLHGWLMASYLKEQEAGQMEAFLLLILGPAWNVSNVQGIQAESITPSAASAALSVAIVRQLPSLPNPSLLALDSQFDGLLSSLGVCEKLLRTPIPIGYTRYTVRFLWIWLSLLPFGLANKFLTFGDGTWWEDKPKPILMITMGFIGFIFLSIEDIAVQIEEPFRVLPLEKHQEWLHKEAQQIKALHLAHVDSEPLPSRDVACPNETHASTLFLGPVDGI